MADNPFALVRRRLGRAVDWRVDAAVQRSAPSGYEHVREVVSTLERERLDVLPRLAALEVQVRQLDVAIKKLRASISSLSVSLTDAQRTQGELLDQLASKTFPR